MLALKIQTKNKVHMCTLITNMGIYYFNVSKAIY